MDKRGSVSIMIAAGALPAMFLTGVYALNATRHWVVEARLQSAVDAAVIAVGRSSAQGEAAKEKIATDMVIANFNGGGGPGTLLPGVKVTETPARARCRSRPRPR